MTARTLARRDESLRELMDEPDCDDARLRRTLERFALVNRLVSGWGTVYRDRIRPVLRARDAPARVLDIGCGAGDVLRGIVSRARADGFDVDAVGIDPDERGLAVALPMPGVEYRAGTAAELVAEGDAFDVVISNHVLHHLPTDVVPGFLADSALLSSGVALHSDIGRSRLAYAAYAVGISPLAPGSFLRTDGLRSIRRSWRADELAGLVPAGWEVTTPVPFRVLAAANGSAP